MPDTESTEVPSQVCETLAEVAETLAGFGPPYIVKEAGDAADRDIVSLDHAGCRLVVVEVYPNGHPDQPRQVGTLLNDDDYRLIGDALGSLLIHGPVRHAAVRSLCERHGLSVSVDR